MNHSRLFASSLQNRTVCHPYVVAVEDVEHSNLEIGSSPAHSVQPRTMTRKHQPDTNELGILPATVGSETNLFAVCARTVPCFASYHALSAKDALR